MRIFVLIVFGILLNSCKNSSSIDSKIQTEKSESGKISVEQLNGKWYLNKWTYYHTLDFNGERIFVDNHIDSVFYLKYRISYDTLITWSENSKMITKNRILKVSKDSLIFEEFLNAKHQIHYSKTERKMEN